MITVLFAGRNYAWAEFEGPLRQALSDAGIDAHLVREAAPETVDYVIYAPNSHVQDFAPFTRCRAVLSLWAGVEQIVGNETLTQPLARMVDHGLTEGMVEWCVGHTLRHHLGLDLDIRREGAEWVPRVPPLARDRRVTVLGLGALGCAVATALDNLNFAVTGWSRSAKALDGIQCLSGDDGLRDALTGAEVLIMLLPLTGATDSILNAERLALLAEGAIIINPGRGQLIDDDALLAALDNGHVAHATLDVFREEPLPEGHPYWAHPRVTVTPHIASHTRPVSASRVIVENIRRGEAGEPFLHLVDRTAGY